MVFEFSAHTHTHTLSHTKLLSQRQCRDRAVWRFKTIIKYSSFCDCLLYDKSLHQLSQQTLLLVHQEQNRFQSNWGFTLSILIIQSLSSFSVIQLGFAISAGPE